MIDTKKFYDEGWNARVLNQPYDKTATLDWKDGWKDCNRAPEKDRSLMN